MFSQALKEVETENYRLEGNISANSYRPHPCPLSTRDRPCVPRRSCSRSSEVRLRLPLRFIHFTLMICL